MFVRNRWKFLSTCSPTPRQVSAPLVAASPCPPLTAAAGYGGLPVDTDVDGLTRRRRRTVERAGGADEVTGVAVEDPTLGVNGLAPKHARVLLHAQHELAG